MAERVTRIVASLNISARRKEYALEPFSLLPMIQHQVSLPLGISSIPFHGVSVKRKLLNVTSIFGCFLLILSSSLTGSRKGRMTSRCSGLGPPPPMARVEASEARRQEAIANPIQLDNNVAESNPKRCIIYMYIYRSTYGTRDHWADF